MYISGRCVLPPACNWEVACGVQRAQGWMKKTERWRAMPLRGSPPSHLRPQPTDFMSHYPLLSLPPTSPQLSDFFHPLSPPTTSPLTVRRLFLIDTSLYHRLSFLVEACGRLGRHLRSPKLNVPRKIPARRGDSDACDPGCQIPRRTPAHCTSAPANRTANAHESSPWLRLW